MKKDQLNIIIKGFEFNVAWFVSLSNLVVALENPQDIVSIKESGREKYSELVRPLHMLYNDCMELLKEQGINLLEAEYQPVSDTTDKETTNE